MTVGFIWRVHLSAPINRENTRIKIEINDDSRTSQTTRNRRKPTSAPTAPLQPERTSSDTRGTRNLTTPAPTSSARPKSNPPSDLPATKGCNITCARAIHSACYPQQRFVRGAPPEARGTAGYLRTRRCTGAPPIFDGIGRIIAALLPRCGPGDRT